MKQDIYEPKEDSLLLQKFVSKYSKGLVLDMGTGSGIQALEAAKKAELVIGLDIDKNAIKYCKKNIKNKNIYFFKSNLFQIFDEKFFYYDKANKKLESYDKKKLKDREKIKILAKKQIKFDLIIFNPPYLPSELKVKDLTVEGGKKGYEILERFFSKVKPYLSRDGKILIIFSSLTNRLKVNDIINGNGFRFKELAKEHIFFEDLFVYLVGKRFPALINKAHPIIKIIPNKI